MIKRLHHVCLLVRSINESLPLWEKLLNAKARVSPPMPSGVRLATMTLPDGSEMELLEPVNPTSAAAKILAEQGEGLHHICLEVDDVDAELTRAGQAGATLVDKKARATTAGGMKMGFYRTMPAGGISVELISKSS